MTSAQTKEQLSPAEEKHQNGLRLLEQGQTEAAIALLTQALQDQPTSELWNDWSAAQITAGHADQAEAGFRRAIGLDPAAAQASANLGLLLTSHNREAEAIPLLKIAAESVGESQRAIVQQALTDCSRKVAADALVHSQVVMQKLVGELQQSWPLVPPPTAPEPAPALLGAVAVPLPLWDENTEFRSICERVKYITLDRLRCFILYQFARQASALPGDVAEVGVYKGGSARILSQTFAPRAQKLVHLFDTFAGMPATDPSVDCHSAGDFADTSLEAVQSDLRDCGNLRFYPGFFPDTAGPIETLKFCLVHVDVDIYPSVRDCCVFFYPRMETNGILLFDDYGFNSCPGARKAVDEFFADKPEKPFYLPTGQCFVLREHSRAPGARR
jgi:O-methyltransferase